MILVRLTLQTGVLALGQIWANKVRAMLTTLGIVIGVASITAVIAALTGLQNNILTEFETFGARKIYMRGDLPRQMWGSASWASVQLTEEELRAIVTHCDSVDQVTPMMTRSYEVRAGDVSRQGVSVTGIWPTWHEIENRSVLLGRPFNRIDDEQRLQVCLINEKGIEELGLPKDPVNEFVLIKGRRFMIVGVVETLDIGAMFGGGETFTEIFIPLNTARNLNPNGFINYAMGQLRDAKSSEDAKVEIGFVLRKMRNLPPEREDTFVVQVMQQFIDQFNRMARVITAGASGIVGISLLVGGIGIMNIMLVSVSERTREIGLRKAMGARPAVILIQFLVEAVVLCLVGAATGLAIGQAMVVLMQVMPDSPLEKASIPPWAVVLSVGFSAATGVIFGMFPAMKAARLNPIDALRHE